MLGLLAPEPSKHAILQYSDAARMNALYSSRSESLSSAGTTAALASLGLGLARTNSSDGSTSADTIYTRPFAPHNGRTYLNDPSMVYPLPVDLTELHRQSMRTLLLIQALGAPACSPAHAARPPKRVLEIGCGSGFWSMMCHRYFRDLGHGDISYTGLDIAPLAPPGGPGGAKPDPDMNWQFVQHDIRVAPFPFPDGDFDLVMVKDMSLAVTHTAQQDLVDEYLRLLRTGGYLEIWESDHKIRMLRPHAPDTAPASSSASSATTADGEEENSAAMALGAYVMTSNTPLSPPLNNYLVEYNSWVVRALELRDLSPVPCTLIGPMLLQESEELADVRSRRLAIPLSEVRWEKEGVGGVAALRRTALEIVVQSIQALEPMLREVSGKRADEWDAWVVKMAVDLMGEGGTAWGECLEVGAWWAQKK
ncbi:related to SAM binding motif containing protein [Cephalotrichum gorgonifer]|uniref:Related to SAM binding motif containing protein n=1 Tax=Cephalotrichum gorgonifer TaxID=2041049 RepID=A0AAE8SRW6_9PEZI|nr:related to SAM binding motif containing protein [Cephalotrichum gorgonifer]